MASIIKLKRSSTQGSIPGSLELGEIAVNLFDRRLYVGNTTGVTAVGGEVFALTVDEGTTNGDGAYIKLLGETAPTTNSVFLQAGEGLDVTLQGNGSITFSGEDATTSNKGIASFATADFNVSSGAVELKDTVVKTVASDSGSATPSTHGITIAGTANEIETSGAGATVTIGLPNDVTIGNALTVTQNGSVGGTLSVDGATSLHGLTATTMQANSTLDVSGLASLDGGIDVDGAFTVADTSGNISTSGTLNVTGQTTLNGGLTMDSGAFSVADTSGNVDTTGTLNVDGATTLNGLTATTFTANSDVTVGGQLDVSENAVVAGNTSVGGDLSVTGDAHIDGSLTVEGALTYISTSTVYADDGMFKLAANNAGDTVDTGIYAAIYNTGNTSYTYSGYFRDATDGIFKFYKDLDAEPTQTVDTGDTGYALAQVDAIIDGGTY